jgi:hypothetical protein
MHCVTGCTLADTHIESLLFVQRVGFYPNSEKTNRVTTSSQMDSEINSSMSVCWEMAGISSSFFGS